MRNCDIYIPPTAFRFLLNNSTTDRQTRTGKPKISIYWRKKGGSLGVSILPLEAMNTFIGMCIFPSSKDEEEYIGYFLKSLRSSQIIESNSVNYRFRTYRGVDRC